jgi:hypothetical protein
MMTTTANNLHREEESRMISLHADQSEKQVKQLLMALADFGGTFNPPKDYVSSWHSLHDYVCSGDLNVEIPYSQELLDAFPGQGRAIRDAQKVLALLQAQALLHQRSRERNAKGYVIATIEDYANIYFLINEPLSQGLHADVPDHIREAVVLVQGHCEKTGKSLSITEIAELLDKDVGTADRTISTSIAEGYLVNHNPGRGKRAEIVPEDRPLPSGSVLPDPEELCELPKAASSQKPRNVYAAILNKSAAP